MRVGLCLCIRDCFLFHICVIFPFVVFCLRIFPYRFARFARVRHTQFPCLSGAALIDGTELAYRGIRDLPVGIPPSCIPGDLVYPEQLLLVTLQ